MIIQCFIISFTMSFISVFSLCDLVLFIPLNATFVLVTSLRWNCFHQCVFPMYYLAFGVPSVSVSLHFSCCSYLFLYVCVSVFFLLFLPLSVRLSLCLPVLLPFYISAYLFPCISFSVSLSLCFSTSLYDSLSLSVSGSFSCPLSLFNYSCHFCIS